MRIMTVVFCILFSFSPVTVLAGANHDHGHSHGHSHDPVDKSQAEKVALKNVARLVKQGKIDKSWSEAAFTEAKMKKYGRKDEWVVTFKNEKASDPAKQTLYVFLTLEGKYLAANFTGK